MSKSRRTDGRKHHKQLFSVFVGHLHLDVTEKELSDLFSGCGRIADMAVMPPKDGGPHKFGFVRYKTREEALRAIKEMNGWPVRSQRIVVDVANDCAARLHSGELQIVETPLINFDPSEVSLQGGRSSCVDSILNLSRVKETCLLVNSELAATYCTGIVKTERIASDLDTKGGASTIPAPSLKPIVRSQLINARHVAARLKNWESLAATSLSPTVSDLFLEKYNDISKTIAELTKCKKPVKLEKDVEKGTSVVKNDHDAVKEGTSVVKEDGDAGSTALQSSQPSTDRSRVASERETGHSDKETSGKQKTRPMSSSPAQLANSQSGQMVSPDSLNVNDSPSANPGTNQTRTPRSILLERLRIQSLLSSASEASKLQTLGTSESSTCGTNQFPNSGITPTAVTSEMLPMIFRQSQNQSCAAPHSLRTSEISSLQTHESQSVLASGPCSENTPLNNSPASCVQLVPGTAYHSNTDLPNKPPHVQVADYSMLPSLSPQERHYPIHTVKSPKSPKIGLLPCPAYCSTNPYVCSHSLPIHWAVPPSGSGQGRGLLPTPGTQPQPFNPYNSNWQHPSLASIGGTQNSVHNSNLTSDSKLSQDNKDHNLSPSSPAVPGLSQLDSRNCSPFGQKLHQDEFSGNDNSDQTVPENIPPDSEVRLHGSLLELGRKVRLQRAQACKPKAKDSLIDSSESAGHDVSSRDNEESTVCDGDVKKVTLSFSEIQKERERLWLSEERRQQMAAEQEWEVRGHSKNPKQGLASDIFCRILSSGLGHQNPLKGSTHKTINTGKPNPEPNTGLNSSSIRQQLGENDVPHKDSLSHSSNHTESVGSVSDKEAVKTLQQHNHFPINATHQTSQKSPENIFHPQTTGVRASKLAQLTSRSSARQPMGMNVRFPVAVSRPDYKNELHMSDGSISPCSSPPSGS